LTYLDHGGTTLASKSLMKSFGREMQANLLSNPHSDASNPSISALMVESTRQKVLKLFRADPAHFDVVFTANATGAVKLVAECFSGHATGFNYYYHRNCHTSLVGVRELARESTCLADERETQQWLERGEASWTSAAAADDDSSRPTLFSYPAQSNMNGERLPLEWSAQIRRSGFHPNTYTLLDVAAFVSTTPLDLSDPISAPDFTALSFYKIFGFPDLGALIVRKDSAHVLDHRRYFGGGTTEMITCIKDPWVARKESSTHARLEDGTIAIRSILALSCAIDTHQDIFGGLDNVSKHTSWLATALYSKLAALKHVNGVPVCHIYKAPSSAYGNTRTQGATVTFNVRASNGTWIGGWRVGSILRANKIHVRTGSLCNPAGMANALGLSAAELRAAFTSGFRCNQEADVRGDVPFGMVRATFGAMSTLKDVEALVRVMQHQFVDRGLADVDVIAASECFSEKTVVEQGPASLLGPAGDPMVPKMRRSVWGAFSVCFSASR
jgi:molybdenum cofactor sulfurtransferase